MHHTRGEKHTTQQETTRLKTQTMTGAGCKREGNPPQRILRVS